MADDSDRGTDALAARWRDSANPEDLTALAAHIAPGTARDRLRGLLGEPLLVTPLAEGGESWLYVRSDPASEQYESIAALLSPDGRFDRLARKPIE